WLIAHGSADEAVPHSAALQLHQWNTQSKLHILKDAGHTFGGAHPWYDKELPVDTRTLVQVTIEFFLEQ
ncbi:MAG: dienelactone hydrolase, partial [Chitinophagales bacterium]|nr:dienelactone hydrolase [Chitinophagales bacterium]